eukprot:403340932
MTDQHLSIPKKSLIQEGVNSGTTREKTISPNTIRDEGKYMKHFQSPQQDSFQGNQDQDFIHDSNQIEKIQLFQQIEDELFQTQQPTQ